MSIFEQVVPVSVFIAFCLLLGILVRKIAEDRWDI